MAYLEDASIGSLRLTGQGGGDGTALLMNAGSSSNKATTKLPTKVFMQHYLESTATSGSVQGQYTRVYANGAGAVTALAVRPFVTVQQAIANAYGTHSSISFATAGTITGLAVASRNTLQVPNGATLVGTGTFAAVQAEVFLDGTSSDVSGAAEHSILRLTIGGGDATSQNKFKNAIAIRTLQTDGSGNMIYTHTHTEGQATGSIRILVNGAVKYLKFWDAE